MGVRVGQAVDIHALVPGRDLIIGGVHIPHDKGLLGHSDADVLLHAIGESILGALALKDLGSHFPDTDPRYAGVSSLFLLEQIYEMMRKKGWHIGNVDATILAEKPKMAPYIDEMVLNVADCLHCSPDQISIKATRGEKLGFVGRQEGITALAICLLESKSCG